MSSNAIVHWELMGPDAGVLRTFYEAIFDWQFQTPEGFDNYHMIPEEGMNVGGAIGQGNEHMPTYQAIYVRVPNIEKSLAQIEENGGSTLLGRTEVPDMVTFALFSDPAGNTVGLVEASDS